MPPTRLLPEHHRALITFASGDLEASAFESWLYGAVSLDAHLTPDEYLALFSPDFRTAAGVAAAREAAANILDSRTPHDTVRHQTAGLVAAVLDGSVPLLWGLQQLARLAHESPDLIPGHLATLASDFEGVPTEASHDLYAPSYVARQLSLLEAARPGILSDLADFLRALQGEPATDAPPPHSAP